MFTELSRQSKLDTVIKVQETFQETIQGEGFWAGSLSDFIRFYGCNVGCHFCDTGYSQGSDRALSYTEKTVRELISELKSPRVVITGGEPTIHKELWVLLDALVNETGKRIQVETAGLKWRVPLQNAWVTLSPKTHLHPKAVIDPLFWERADELKLVIVDGSEFEFYREIIDSMNSETPIYLQPEWSTRANAVPIILNLMKEYPRARMSLQAHKYVHLP